MKRRAFLAGLGLVVGTSLVGLNGTLGFGRAAIKIHVANRTTQSNLGAVGFDQDLFRDMARRMAEAGVRHLDKQIREVLRR